jgi:hypothetical protein
MTQTPTTYTLQIEQGIGYSGKHGARAYVAAITGSSQEYGLAREFVAADTVTRDSYRRARYTRTYTYHLRPGLYEVSECGDRQYLMVWHKADGTAGHAHPPMERVRAMVRLMDAGESYDGARLLTRPAAPAAPAV